VHRRHRHEGLHGAADLGAARRLGSSFVSVAPLYAGNRVDVLVDGNATYDAMGHAIDRADTSVQLEIYILADDAVGRRLVERLVRCARRGVCVQLVLDALGCRSARRRLVPTLAAAGIDVRVFHPLDIFAPRRSWRRDHRKLLVVDGRVAFTGGINFSESYASRRRSRLSPRRAVRRGWRDTHVQVQGPAVRAFEQAFALRWQALAAAEPEHAAAPGAPVVATRARPPLREMGDTLVGALPSSAVDDRPSEIIAAIQAAIRLARRRVWLTQAYFAPSDELIEGLCARATAGVDVRLLLPYRSDFYPVQFAARAHYGRLLRAGVRVFEYQPAVLHAKTIVVDGLWASVGSCNLDWRSLHYNDELNAVLLGRAVGAEFERVFERDLAHAEEIALHAWSRRSLHRRAAERLARWLSPLW
jgi:cardiolipin synthase